MATIAPFIGRRRRLRFNRFKKPSHAELSTTLWLSCVVYRPAVSISTASFVNHQSQLRVPPTPCSAPLPNCSAKGKSNVELISAVVLPEPGGPIMIYQGNSYNA